MSSWELRQYGHLPLSLLQQLADPDLREQLSHPPPNLPCWVAELAILAIRWLGLEYGVVVWNSQCLALTPKERELRWRLALAFGICPPPEAREEFLVALLEVLPTARPEHLACWHWLQDCSRDLESTRVLWSLPIDRERLKLYTKHLDEGLALVLQEAPQRRDEYLSWLERIDLPECLELSEVARLFLDCPRVTERMQVLLCLEQMERDGPDGRLLEAGNHLLAEAARHWQADYSTEVPEEVASSLELEPARLGRLLALRELNGKPKVWPKTVRRWLDRRENAPSPEHRLKQLLKVQQNFEVTLRDESRSAWRTLVKQTLARLLHRLCGRDVPEDLVLAAWLLRRAETRMSSLNYFWSEQPLADLPHNRAWVAPSNLDRTVWDGGLQRQLDWGGQTLYASTASPAQALRMGSDFHTCLTLRDGEQNASLLTNVLDVNKQVLYLRDRAGTPWLRQLVAIDRNGALVCYPVYTHHGDSALLCCWRELVADYAKECGLKSGGRPDRVRNLHEVEGYYSDREEQPEDSQRGPGSDRLEFYQIVRGRSPVRQISQTMLERLARSGETGWLDRCRRPYLAPVFWKKLDYLADPVPLARYLRRRTSWAPLLRGLPVALEGLSVEQLLRTFTKVTRRQVWPGTPQALQMLVLFWLAWKREPDPPALWRSLRGNLQPLLWFFLALLPEPVFPCLLRRPPRSYPYTWILAAGRRFSAQVRQFLAEKPWTHWAAAALHYWGESVGVPRHPHLVGERQRALMCDIQGDSPNDVSWSLSRHSFACLERGLQGDEEALEQWAFRCAPDQLIWRLELLARLRLKSPLNLPRERLRAWFRRAGGQLRWAARDLGEGWYHLSAEELAEGLRRCPELAWGYWNQVDAEERALLARDLAWMVDSASWDKLSLANELPPASRPVP
ncbi:MAG: hypothetical protein J0I12_01885 [Candidatus Eremiobacteraeota bacterium]|nr:hypothetical protein [Candidatus Eremiobacteraeota bacterium]